MSTILQRLVVFFICLCTTAHASVISFQSNGYRGIRVSIHKGVKENSHIINQIKELFRNASESLFEATNNMAYFDEVTIEIPSTWSDKSSYEPTSGGSSYLQADIRVAGKNPTYGDNPYTLQPAGCGQRGQYIHLTPTFISNKGNTDQDSHYDRAKQLVHEWAHFRYGVYDEYGYPGDDKYPTFYIDDKGKIRPTSCKNDIIGWLSTSDGGPCTILEGKLLPDEDCRFVPHPTKNTATSSLMYSSSLPSIKRFCDNETNTQHNIQAPNKHNNLCMYKSTWQVIMENSDFKDVRPALNNPTPPKFRIVKPKIKTTFLLALDVSGSMKKNNRILTLRHAATRFILHHVPDDSLVGILSFSESANELISVTKVNDKTRKVMVKSLPTDTSTDTAIGSALQKSLEMLSVGGQSSEGAVIVLITDGKENVRPAIKDVIGSLVKAKVFVNSIAIGSKASGNLEMLSAKTGGKVFYFPDEMPNQSLLDNAFVELSTSRADPDTEAVLITTDSLAVDSQQSVMKTIIIDKGVGNNTKFIFGGKEIVDADVIVHSPSGEQFESGNRNFVVNPLTRSLVLNPKSFEFGEWNITVRNKLFSRQHYDITVTSEPRDEEPIRVKSWFNNFEVKFPDKVQIFVEATKGFVPVVGATVIAEVTNPQGRQMKIALLDNGSGPDIAEDDGIYSHSFARYTANGRYSVSISVVNEGGAKLMQSKRKMSTAPVHTVDRFQNSKAKASFSANDFEIRQHEKKLKHKSIKQAEKFQRSSITGSFKLTNWYQIHGDTLPPERITDLRAYYKESDVNSPKLNLLWTVPEDNEELSFDLRLSWKKHPLLNRYANAYRVTHDEIVDGAIISTSNIRNNITIQIDGDQVPFHNVTRMNLYIAIKAVDPARNTASISNIAYVTFGASRVKISPPGAFHSGAMAKIIGIVAGCIVGTAIIGFLAVFSYKRYKKSDSDEEFAY